MSQSEVRKYLPAFADGELDVEQNLRVLEAMAMDPTHTRRVLHQQQLRKACARAMDRAECTCPDTLRQTLLGMHAATASQTPAAIEAADGRGPVLARIGRWVPAAVAAVLLIGAMAAFFSPRTGAPTTTEAFPISQARLTQFTNRHSTCSSDTSKLIPGIENPTNVAALPGTIDDYFGDQAGKINCKLDLSILGYNFERVGKCSLPGKNAVHVVYKATEPDANRSLSLWIRPDTGDLNLAPEILHTALSPEGKPLLLWKRNGRVYYLVGDAPDDAHRAARMLAMSNSPLP